MAHRYDSADELVRIHFLLARELAHPEVFLAEVVVDSHPDVLEARLLHGRRLLLDHLLLADQGAAHLLAKVVLCCRVARRGRDRDPLGLVERVILVRLDAQILTVQLVQGLDKVPEELPDELLTQERDQVLQRTAQILVEDHAQGEAGLVYVLVEALTDAHQDDLDHLLELTPRHLDFVEEALGSDHHIAGDGEFSRRMPQLVGLLEATVLWGSCALPVLSL